MLVNMLALFTQCTTVLSTNTAPTIHLGFQAFNECFDTLEELHVEAELTPYSLEFGKALEAAR